MREIKIDQAAALIAEQLPKGAFLCVGGDTPNVMTVGWGGLSYFWVKNVYIAPIRPQRATYPLLAEQGRFTISVPHPGEMKEALAKAGTLSGRDGDKFAAIGLPTRKATAMDAPVVEGCALYLECIVRARAPFDGKGTDPAIVSGTYPTGDFHELFFGEIIACYAGE